MTWRPAIFPALTLSKFEQLHSEDLLLQVPCSLAKIVDRLAIGPW